LDTKYYIGIDSGGTQTRALAALPSGEIVGSAITGSANRNHFTREQIRDNLGAAVATTLCGLPSSSSPKTIFIGTSGVSTDQDRREIYEIICEAPGIDRDDQITVDNDTIIALTGGLSGRPGIALVAGTGSACFGVNEYGERYLCGGWGALADDVGSAPWLGMRSVQAAVRAQDGRMPPTALQDIVFDFLDLKEPRDLIGRVHDRSNGLTRSDLGAMAPRVLDACRNGDTTALDLLHEATEELAALACVTAARLFENSPCDIILVGGLARSGHPFQTELVAALARRAPLVTVREPDLSPVHGAVLEALRAGGVKWNAGVWANVSAHYEKRGATNEE
jgi:glucosamine kinase